MKTEIKPATLRDLCYTAANAREIDKKEIFASGPRTMQECGTLTWSAMYHWGGIGWCCWVEDNPEYAFGFTPQSPFQPWLWSAWGWGTDKAVYAMPEVIRWCKANLVPMLDSVGAIRVEARALENNDDSIRWLKWMNFKYDCDLPRWGRDGLTFVQLSWLREEFPGFDKYGNVVRKRGTDHVLRRQSTDLPATAPTAAVD